MLCAQDFINPSQCSYVKLCPEAGDHTWVVEKSVILSHCEEHCHRRELTVGNRQA